MCVCSRFVCLQNDIDSMRSHLDFTYDPVRFAEFPRFISDLKTKYGQHYMVITDPGISNTQPAGEYAPFDDGNKLALWVNNSNSTPFVGPVWPGPCVFPDFFNPATAAYWQDQLQTFHVCVVVVFVWVVVFVRVVVVAATPFSSLSVGYAMGRRTLACTPTGCGST